MNFKKNFFPPYKVLMILYLFMILFALLLNTPSEIFSGLKEIILSPDILITDNMEVGGIGAALVNASLTSIASIILLLIAKVRPTGSTIMSLWLMTGFCFLGKNLFNIWPIILGVYIFSRIQKEPFRNYSLIALLGTSLAPIVSQVAFGSETISITSLLLGISLGVLAGIILPPIASHSVRAHNGYNLYNIGFACGLIATLFMSIFRSIGVDFSSRLIWHTGSNNILFIFLMIVCIYLIILGVKHPNTSVKTIHTPTKNTLFKLNKESGRLVTDFFFLYGEITYINMGILGIMSTFFIIIIGGDLNGATICGIFTIMGFGCFGKNIRNVIPVMLGATLAALFNISPINSPSLILSILFSTTLAPIAGKFGFTSGIIAGIVHVNIVSSIGYLHGGLNLYNNGLAGGFAAMILIPIITTFKKEASL